MLWFRKKNDCGHNREDSEIVRAKWLKVNNQLFQNVLIEISYFCLNLKYFAIHERIQSRMLDLLFKTDIR